MIDKSEVDEVVLFFDDEKEKTEFFDMVNADSSEFLKAFMQDAPPATMPSDNEHAYDIAMSLKGSKILAEWFQQWKTTKGKKLIIYIHCYEKTAPKYFTLERSY